MESAVVMCSGNEITLTDLPPAISQGTSSDSISIPLGIPLAEAEKAIIQANLAANRNNKSKTADVLQIGRRTLMRKLSELTLEEEADSSDEYV